MAISNNSFVQLEDLLLLEDARKAPGLLDLKQNTYLEDRYVRRRAKNSKRRGLKGMSKKHRRQKVSEFFT